MKPTLNTMKILNNTTGMDILLHVKPKNRFRGDFPFSLVGSMPKNKNPLKRKEMRHMKMNDLGIEVIY